MQTDFPPQRDQQAHHFATSRGDHELADESGGLNTPQSQCTQQITHSPDGQRQDAFVAVIDTEIRKPPRDSQQPERKHGNQHRIENNDTQQIKPHRYRITGENGTGQQ